MRDWKQWVDNHACTRILLAKTSSAIYIREALGVLRRELPRSEIILWTEERESEEFYRHPAVASVVLYRNLRSTPSMLRELDAFAPYLVVTERTDEPAYSKMLLFSCVLLRAPGVIFDDSMRVVAFGGWMGRLVRTTAGVLATAIRQRMQARQMALSIARFLVSLASIVAAPFVLLALLAGAVRIEIWRRLGASCSASAARDHET